MFQVAMETRICCTHEQCEHSSVSLFIGTANITFKCMMSESASHIEQIVIHHSSGIFPRNEKRNDNIQPNWKRRKSSNMILSLTETRKFLIRLFKIALDCRFEKGFHVSTATHLSFVSNRPVNYPRKRIKRHKSNNESSFGNCFGN